MRQNKVPTGAYAGRIQGWLAGTPNGPIQSVPLAIDRTLTPTENLPLVDPEDFAFLTISHGFTGIPAPLLTDDVCQPGLGNLTLSGYPGGQQINNVHGGIVTPVTYSLWTFTNFLPSTGAGILNPGMGTPLGGVSGGGVFSEGRYGGVYRGQYVAVGQHNFIPVNVLRRWCLSHGYELVDLTVIDQVSSIKQTLAQIADTKSANPAMSALIEIARPDLAELRGVLIDFAAYKKLHDQLHQIQIQFVNAAIAVRTQPLNGDALNRFATAMDAAEPMLEPTRKMIAEYSGTKAAFKRYEASWLARLTKAIKIGQEMDIESTAAVEVSNQLRSVLSTQLPRINGLLTENASVMDLARLGRLFGDIGALASLPAGVAEDYKQSEANCQTLWVAVQQLIEIHNRWQDIDVTLWAAERALPAAAAGSSEEFDLQWSSIVHSVSEMVAASAVTGDVEWSMKMPRLLGDVADALSKPGRPSLTSAFDRAARVIRNQFVRVDNILKSHADRIVELRSGLEFA